MGKIMYMNKEFQGRIPRVEINGLTPTGDYSTSETFTGLTWIDGKPIYKQTLYYETAAAGNALNHKFYIKDIDTLIKRESRCNIQGQPFQRMNDSWTELWYGGCHSDHHHTKESFWQAGLYYTYNDYQITFWYTKTTDQPITPDLNKPNYSLTEQFTGITWVDGRKIYQKTIRLEDILANSYELYSTGLTGVGTVVDREYIADRGQNGIVINDEWIPQSNWAGFCACTYFAQDNGTLKVQIQNNTYAIDDLYLTIRYTKSAESPITPPTDKINYSMTEQNTGLKWIDGKDIYQKTVYWATIPRLSGGNYKNVLFTGTTTLDKAISYEMVSTRGDNGGYYARDGKSYTGSPNLGIYQIMHLDGDTCVEIDTNTTNGLKDVYFTLRYTKQTGGE